MSVDTDAAGQVKDKVGQAAATAGMAARNPWVERMTRFGYFVRGVLYAMIGLLAVGLVFGAGGKTTDKAGAIATIGTEPFGKLLLAIMLLGLAGYSLWGF